MPGAPCSVIDANEPSSIGSGSKQDSIQIPMKFGNGRTTIVSSSTMSPEFLKEMRDAAEADVAGRDKLPPESFTVEMGRLSVGSGSKTVDQCVESEEVDRNILGQHRCTSCTMNNKTANFQLWAKP